MCYLIRETIMTSSILNLYKGNLLHDFFVVKKENFMKKMLFNAGYFAVPKLINSQNSAS